MFAIGTRVMNRVGIYSHGVGTVGTVVGIDELWHDGTDWQAELLVEWDSDNWSEYRPVESLRSDEIVNVLAV